MEAREKLIKNALEALELTGMKHFIHKESFDLLSYPDEIMALDADMELFEDSIKEIENNPDNYVQVEPISSSEGFIIMEDFTDTVRNISKQNALMRALNRRNPFRQFRYALEDVELLESWYEYKNQAYKNLANRWVEMFLEEEQINI